MSHSQPHIAMTLDRFARIFLSILPIFAVAVILPPDRAAAQTVRGVVVEDGTMKPLPGAFVVLVDEAGERRGGVLANDDGRFFLRAVAPGSYRLVAELIGYAGTETNPIELAAGDIIEYTLQVPVQAVSLEGISVQTEARCRPHPGSGLETARLWDEARKALEVTHWGEEQEALNMRIMQYSRELSANAHSVREASQQARTAYYKASPYISRPAEELAETGYIVEAEDNQFDYFAPDAEVLLSDIFLDSHCFAVVESQEDSSLVGLRFEPVTQREVADIEGVLWLDRATAALRSLDFRYTRLPFRGVTSSEAGGRVEFEQLSNGAWIVNQWRLRMPVVAETRQPGWRSSRTELEVVALNETGAEVQSVRDLEGNVLAEAAGATLYGMVWDSVMAEPLADATVTLDETDHSTVTAIDGTYRFTGLPSGVYRVRFSHPNLDILGVELEPRVVALESGGGHRVPLAIPDGRRIAEVVCTDRTEAQAYVYGRVMDSSRTWPIEDAVVRLEGVEDEPMTVTADSDGIFRLCVPPSPRPVRVVGFRPDDRGALATGGAQPPVADSMALDIATPKAVRHDLTVEMPATRVFSTWANRINGRVLDRSAKEPIPGATVILSDSLGRTINTVVTNEDGIFQLPHPGTGERFVVEAEHIGYSKSTGRVAFGSRDELNVELLMDVRPVELEPIVVVERRRDYLAEMGYYMRKDRGLGKFIERVEIERYRPTMVTDVIRRTPGVTISGLGLSADVEMMGARRVGGFEGTGGLKCLPAIYLDGALVRPGGNPERPSTRPASGGIGTFREPAYTPLNEIVQPEHVEAIEVYRRVSEVPARYRADDACGVIAIWTIR